MILHKSPVVRCLNETESDIWAGLGRLGSLEFMNLRSQSGNGTYSILTHLNFHSRCCDYTNQSIFNLIRLDKGMTK